MPKMEVPYVYLGQLGHVKVVMAYNLVNMT